MKLSDIINQETATLEQAQAVNTALHKLFNEILRLWVRCIVDPEFSEKKALGSMYDMLLNLDIDSLHLVEDILDEMMDKEDEGGII